MKGNGTVAYRTTDNTVLGNNSQSPAALGNHLEALKVLTLSILGEVEALKKEKNYVVQDKINFAEEVLLFEKDLIRCALLRTGGRQRQAARLLNIKATTLNAVTALIQMVRIRETSKKYQFKVCQNQSNTKRSFNYPVINFRFRKIYIG
ncbi:MAG: helix-turn-helix domain-containing protein [Acidobacteria bacterium]|nr:helix-turn-helix domain-containing protein [Acidobacteriota bacterium]